MGQPLFLDVVGGVRADGHLALRPGVAGITAPSCSAKSSVKKYTVTLMVLLSIDLDISALPLRSRPGHGPGPGVTQPPSRAGVRMAASAARGRTAARRAPGGRPAGSGASPAHCAPAGPAGNRPDTLAHCPRLPGCLMIAQMAQLEATD